MISLAIRRRRLDMTQAELGRLVGLYASSISLAEKHDGPSSGLSRGSFDRIVETVRQLELDSGRPPLRDYRIRERRERLGLALSDMAERAFFHPGQEHRLVRVERGEGAADDLATVRRALIWEESAPRRKREEARKDAARIARQETLFAGALRPSDANAQALMAAMLERCLVLMHEGRGEECDAIAEWLPRDRVEQMFAQWSVESSADFKCDQCRPIPLEVLR